MPRKINREGEITKDKNGTYMKIIKYKNYDDIFVEFLDEYHAIIHSDYDKFKRKSIKNPYFPSVYGVGYLGQGKYNAVENGKITIQYNYWKAMMQRCYCKSINKHTSAYNNVSVCKEWHNFQNFAKWFDKNFYSVSGEKMSLDKDILKKGNTIYSPETCIFAPMKINQLFIKNKTVRNSNLCIGVRYNKNKNKYQAQCGTSDEKRVKTICCVDTLEEAFNKYKEYKENLIKSFALQHKDKIPNKLYKAMMSYEVLITD